MDTDRRALLLHQLRVTWGLATETLEGLTNDECLWQPSPASWTVRPDASWRWTGDWVEPEPENAAAPSLGWVLWHANWWWAMVIDHSFGARTLRREDVEWRGAAAALAGLRSLHDLWEQILIGLTDDDLTSASRTNWPYTDGRPFAEVAGWVNIELMKNVAEMAMLRRFAKAAG